MTLRREAFLGHVQERGEYGTAEEAERAARVVLALAFVVTFPVNRWLISRGQGHALVHTFHASSAAPTETERHHEHA